MAAQVAQPPQQPWLAASSPTYPPRMSALPPTDSHAAQRDSVRASMMSWTPQRTSMAQQERMPDEQDAWGGEYVGFRFKKPDDPTAQQQAQEESGESSGASTPESGGSSSGWSSGADASGVAGGMPAQKGNRKALRKLSRLVKRRGNDVAIITVFNSDGQILCSLAGKQAGQEHTYEPSSDEGKYLMLALERGFKKQGCEFDFGGTVWLSGPQEEVDDKQTMLGNESTDEFRHHRFYGVLSPTGRYVVAAVLKEGSGGHLDAKLLRKMRATADNFEVYEAWAGSGKLMAKLACAA